MKINPVSEQISFKRAIAISSDSHVSKNTLNNSVKQLENVLNNKKNNTYKKRERAQIIEFFRTVLTDYNGKDGIITRNINGQNILLSGAHAKRVIALEEENINLTKEIYRNTSISESEKQILIKQNTKKVKEKTKKLLENGRPARKGRTPKPESNINLNFDSPSSIKPDSIEYYTYQKTYNKLTDGYADTEQGTFFKQPKTGKFLTNTEYEYKKLDLKV